MFFVSPNTDPQIIEETLNKNLVSSNPTNKEMLNTIIG